MANCAAINPAAGSAETMVSTVDCYMQSNVQAGYANLLGPGSMFSYGLTIALTLYVALVGYRLIFGRSTLSMGEMMPRMVMIGAVLALTSNWATYQVLVYDVLTDGPQEIVSTINPAAGKAGSITERVDVLSGRMVDLADAWTEFDARPEQAMPAGIIAEPETLPATATGITAFVAPKDSLGPNMLLLSALLLVLASAGVLVVAKIILGLLLMLGPIFAVLGLFAATRGLTLGWGRAADICRGSCIAGACADRNVCRGRPRHFLAPFGTHDNGRGAGYGRGIGAVIPHRPDNCQRLDALFWSEPCCRQRTDYRAVTSRQRATGQCDLQ
jgi:type IV secretion system protein VirB6